MNTDASVAKHSHLEGQTSKESRSFLGEMNVSKENVRPPSTLPRLLTPIHATGVSRLADFSGIMDHGSLGP